MVEGDLMQDDATEPIRTLLAAAERLEALAAQKEAEEMALRSTARSTRVLVRLMEGWCVDQALRARHPALAALQPQVRDDDAVLAALRGYLRGRALAKRP